MSAELVAISRTLLGALFTAAVAIQVIGIPWVAGEMEAGNPELAYLRLPLTVLAILVFGCAEVVLLCSWMLLSKASNRTLVTRAATIWLGVAIAALLVAIALLIALLPVPVRFGGPPLVMLALTTGIAVATGLTVTSVYLLRRISHAQHDGRDKEEAGVTTS